MDEALSALLSRAFHRAKAAEANHAIAQVRESEGDPAQPAVSYECVIPSQGAAEHLMTKVLPRMVYFLECSGARLPHCQGVFLSIFVEGDLYFVRAGDAVEELARISGLTLEQLVERYGSESA
jgi:hypothetical protein